MTTHAILAEFSDPGALLHAAMDVRGAGYTCFDCHSPFAIHGMDAAMGLKRSPIGYIVAACAVLGAGAGFLLQTWVTTSAYPLVYSGKPLFSWQAYIIVTFAMFVLFGALGGVIAMIRLNRLPRFHHPLFFSDNIGRVTDNAFMVSIEAGDPMFDEAATRTFLETIGGTNIELVKGD